MSEKGDWPPGNPGITKNIGKIEIYLGYSCDVINGKGWFAQVFNEGNNVSSAFHKKNKFTAIRTAIKNLPTK